MQRLRSNKKSVFFFIVLAIFIVYALSLILPFLWAFMTTFKTEAEYINNKAYFPDIIDWTNYIDAFRTLSTNNTNMFVMLFNSLWWSFGSTILAVAASTMSAYVVAKYKFPGRQVIYGIALFTMMLPIIGALPSQYTVYSALGILDNPAMLISTIGGFGFNFFVLYGFFKVDKPGQINKNVQQHPCVTILFNEVFCLFKHIDTSFRYGAKSPYKRYIFSSIGL